MEAAASWTSVAVSLVLGLVGVVVALNIRRDMRLKVAERRLSAYERLWAATSVTSPYGEPLNEEGRNALHACLTGWYYANGDGLLLENVSKSVYLAAKDNLILPVDKIVPLESRRKMLALSGSELERQRGLLARRQFSLLRNQLKSDLAEYGRPYVSGLDPEDVAFLRACGVKVNRKPWKVRRAKLERAFARVRGRLGRDTESARRGRPPPSE